MLTNIALLSAYTAGFASFFAPCCLPLFPSYFSVISGYSFSDLYGLTTRTIRIRIVVSVALFVLGFSIIFTLLGVTSAIVGQAFASFFTILMRLNGLMLIVFGLFQLGVIRMDMFRFDFAWTIQRRLTRLSYFTATVTGIAAGISWIPCIGPLLSPILLLAAQSKTVMSGTVLLFMYSLGLTTPFMLAALFFPAVVDHLREHKTGVHWISRIAGLLLIAFGVLLLLNQYATFLRYYHQLTGVFLQ